MASSSSADGHVPDLSRLSLVADASWQPAPTPIDASLLSVVNGDEQASAIRLRYHAIIARAIGMGEAPWRDVSVPSTGLTTIGEWTAWFKENPQYIDVDSQLVPARGANRDVWRGKFVLKNNLVGVSSTAQVIVFEQPSAPSRVPSGETTLDYLKLVQGGKRRWQYIERREAPTRTGASTTPDASTRLAKRTRGATDSAPIVRTSDGDALTLREEYYTHCTWLHLIQQPSHASFGADMLPPSEAGQIEARSLVTPLEAPDNETDLETAVQNGSNDAVVVAQILEVREELYPESSDLNTPYLVRKELEDVTRTNLARKQTDGLGAAAAKPTTSTEMKRWFRWLKAYMGYKVGTVYMTRGPNRSIDFTRYEGSQPAKDKDPDDAWSENLSVEHVTPASWTRDTRLLEEFWSAHLDPVTLASTDIGVQNERSNRPLWFPPGIQTSTAVWAPTGVAWRKWDSNRLSTTTVAFVARAVVYSSLTYPLLSSDYGNAWKWTTFTERRVSPGGVIDYATQFDRIIALATSDPEEWEVRIAARCWARFGVVNPLAVSDQTRKALATVGHPLRKLLRARWEGRDLCGTECLRTLQTLVQQSEASA